MNCLETALAAHAMGYPVCVVPAGEKGPRTTGWHLKRYSREELEAKFKKKPEPNVGLILGPSASGLVDIECDEKGSEDDLKELFGGKIPKTPCWKSRRGKHYLFPYDPRLGDHRQSRDPLQESGSASWLRKEGCPEFIAAQQDGRQDQEVDCPALAEEQTGEVAGCRGRETPDRQRPARTQEVCGQVSGRYARRRFQHQRRLERHLGAVRLGPRGRERRDGLLAAAGEIVEHLGHHWLLQG